jgi:hypothetical protein
MVAGTTRSTPGLIRQPVRLPGRRRTLIESVVDSVAPPGVPASGLTSSLPMRVVAAARTGLGVALRGERVILNDRLWAYEIEAAAMELASSQALAGVVRVRDYGDKVSFEPVEPSAGPS